MMQLKNLYFFYYVIDFIFIFKDKSLNKYRITHDQNENEEFSWKKAQ